MAIQEPPARERSRHTARSASAIAKRLTAEGEVPASAIRKILDAEYQGDDAGWEAGDAHEACELAVTHLLFGLSRLMNQHAKTPEELDGMVTKTAGVEPRLRGASQRHDRLQHHATPLEIAWAMAVAGDIKPGDRVLDPSAGTGVLLGMAHMAEPAAKLHGNEADPRRADILRMTAPRISVACTDALEPVPQYPEDWGKHDIVLLNPPFSARLGSTGRHRDEGIRHVAAAGAATTTHGRIVALLAGSIRPREDGPAGREENGPEHVVQTRRHAAVGGSTQTARPRRELELAELQHHRNRTEAGADTAGHRGRPEHACRRTLQVQPDTADRSRGTRVHVGGAHVDQGGGRPCTRPGTLHEVRTAGRVARSRPGPLPVEHPRQTPPRTRGRRRWHPDPHVRRRTEPRKPQNGLTRQTSENGA